MDKRRISNVFGFLAATVFVVALGGCNTSKNTATTRFIKGFKSHYNTYFNGQQAYLEGLTQKRAGINDNYMNTLPLLMAGNEDAKKLGSSNFETAVTKCEKTIQVHSIHSKPVRKSGQRLTAKDKEFRLRTEFNPFLWNAWILMGKSQMEKGDFVDAASTFAYTARLYKMQPEIKCLAQSLQAVCYAELTWYYDAEHLLDEVRRAGVPKEAKRYYGQAYTNLYIHQKKWKEALPYLQEEVKHMKHGVEKGRGCFLLSQVYERLGMKKEAYNALSKCIRQSPPYEMRFNAEIAQTEVITGKSVKSKISKLKGMARKSNNKNFLDQVYYAMGNAYLHIPDTTKAINAYEFGGKNSFKKGIPQGMLMLQLGDIYWNREQYSDALRCYKIAVSKIKFENDRFQEIRLRSKVLETLAPHTDVIHLEDSTQALTRMSEKDRNDAIDRTIAIEKKKMEEAEKQRKDSIFKARTSGGRVSATKTDNKTAAKTASTTSKSGVWYFYDQNTINQGMELFQKQWGNRANEDNWRFSDKSGSSKASSSSSQTTATGNDAVDLAKKEEAMSDSVRAANKRKKKGTVDPNDSTDKLSRAYYMTRLPFSQDKLKASNDRLKNALFGAGVIFKDKLDDFPHAKKYLNRLYAEYPDFEPMDLLLYHLFLMELHWGTRDQANVYRDRMAAEFPDSKYTLLITDPYYEEKQKYGVQMEDSIYAEAYNAFRINDYATLVRDCKLSDEKYPSGANRPKFLFLKSMALLQEGNMKDFVQTLQNIKKDFKDDPIAEIAGKYIEGIQQGKKPVGGSYALSDFWASRQTLSAEASDSLHNDTLTAERLEPFSFIMQYSTDSVEEGKLLYNVSRFNFTSFSVRNFDIKIIQSKPLNQMLITGFSNFDEAYTYTKDLYADSTFRLTMKGVTPILVSDHNAQMIGTKYTMEEYLDFYKRHFVPIRVQKDLDLDQTPNNFIWDEFQEVNSEQENEENKNNTKDVPAEDDSGQWY